MTARYAKFAVGCLLLFGTPFAIVAFVTDPQFRAAWLGAAVIATIAALSAITIGDRVIEA